MKSADWLILKQLEKLENMIVVQSVQTSEKLDRILALLTVPAVVSPDLETALKNLSVLAASIDRKVPDKG
jgi:hypothetical protein